MIPTLAITTTFLERPGLSNSTICSYESTLLPLLQQYRRSLVDTLTRQQLEEYLNSLKHLSYTTSNRHQTIVQSLLNFAVEQHLSINPVAHLKRRKPDREKNEHSSDETVRYLNPQQLKLLYSLLKPTSRLHALILLLQRWCFYGEESAQVLETYLRLYYHNNHPALFTAQQFYTKEVTRLSYATAYKD